MVAEALASLAVLSMFLQTAVSSRGRVAAALVALRSVHASSLAAAGVRCPIRGHSGLH